MTETASKGWHSKARALWRSGATENEIAARFSVTPQAVDYALRIVKIAEKGRGRTQPRPLDRIANVAHDQLDCVAMMEAIERGAKGSRSLLRRYAEDA